MRCILGASAAAGQSPPRPRSLTRSRGRRSRSRRRRRDLSGSGGAADSSGARERTSLSPAAALGRGRLHSAPGEVARQLALTAPAAAPGSAHARFTHHHPHPPSRHGARLLPSAARLPLAAPRFSRLRCPEGCLSLEPLSPPPTSSTQF
jgi:hypothetical protein